jgi:ribosomal protein S18 acetylase RimI-like enzyme
MVENEVDNRMSDASVLDNPIWHALNSRHRFLNCGTGLAARYPAEVARFVGLALPSAEAFADLARLVQPREPVALCSPEPLDLPPAWQALQSRSLEQMVCPRLEGDAPHLGLPLGVADVPEMLALAVATEPGPFSPGTIRMGRYHGFRSGDDRRLVAMAGERLRLDGYTEISAVCTDPAFRGRGYAKRLVTGLAARALAEGSIPFLHVKTENGAKGLYEALGFRVRRTLTLTVVTPRQPHDAP